MLPPPTPLSPRQSRVVGALLGLHAGDALGATVEFETHAAIAARHPRGLRDIVGGGPFSWPPGHATDDTDMTRGVLLAYRDAASAAAAAGAGGQDEEGGEKTKKEKGKDEDDGGDVVRRAGDYFLKWLQGDWPGRTHGSRPADIGGATLTGLLRYLDSGDPDRAGAGEGSAGNGSLMRCLPTGLFQLDPARRIEESLRISRITHNDRRCTVACAAYNAIVAELVGGASADEAVRAGEATAARLEGGADGAGPVVAALRLGRRLSVADMARRGPPADVLPGRCAGYVLETLAVGVAAVLDTGRGLEDVLVDVVRLGRDTDTNAAVAGGLLGARDGDGAVPARWRDKLQFADEFTRVALSLTTTTTTTTTTTAP
ncbi:ADP-ribosylglycohydrolase family protein [Purpureocillium lavendulum]|uniref:ADP-ribosylhydrolase ARH3 n=1 Tax=Purpureocillium lavendulum TaxID=1247861 RepID=A0AB34FSF2_9HYPO|nr:ADP-ribosylglycohydrolase family protein [Purpureocillium lavendulum]